MEAAQNTIIVLYYATCDNVRNFQYIVTSSVVWHLPSMGHSSLAT